MAFRLSIENSSVKINFRHLAVFLAGVLTGLAIDQALDSLGKPINFGLGFYTLTLFCFFILYGMVVEVGKGSEKTSEESYSEAHGRNVCSKLKISGEPEKIREAFDSIYDDTNGNLNFERVCVTPKDISSSVDSAIWRLKHWGCTGVQLSTTLRIKATNDITLPINQIQTISGSNTILIEFSTFEGAPITLIEKLADNNPGLKFELTTMI